MYRVRVCMHLFGLYEHENVGRATKELTGEKRFDRTKTEHGRVDEFLHVGPNSVCTACFRLFGTE